VGSGSERSLIVINQVSISIGQRHLSFFIGEIKKLKVKKEEIEQKDERKDHVTSFASRRKTHILTG